MAGRAGRHGRRVPVLRRLIEIVSETGSTNADLAMRLGAGELVPEGNWLVADRQTAGRGRRGKQWEDRIGNFAGSTVVHRRFGDPDAATLALLAGLGLIETIDPHLPTDVRLTLKWPNDVMVGQAKLAGILLERVGEAIVVGIGVNLAHAPDLPERDAISVAQLGSSLERDAFATELARQFDMELERWRNFGLAPIIKRWMAAAHPRGTRLEVTDAGGQALCGSFEGLDDCGAMQLRLADGSVRVIHGGEVNLPRNEA